MACTPPEPEPGTVFATGYVAGLLAVDMRAGRLIVTANTDTSIDFMLERIIGIYRLTVEKVEE